MGYLSSVSDSTIAVADQVRYYLPQPEDRFFTHAGKALIARVVCCVSMPIFATLSATYQAFAFVVKAPGVILTLPLAPFWNRPDDLQSRKWVAHLHQITFLAVKILISLFGVVSPSFSLKIYDLLDQEHNDFINPKPPKADDQRAEGEQPASASLEDKGKAALAAAAAALAATLAPPPPAAPPMNAPLSPDVSPPSPNGSGPEGQPHVDDPEATKRAGDKLIANLKGGAAPLVLTGLEDLNRRRLAIEGDEEDGTESDFYDDEPESVHIQTSVEPSSGQIPTQIKPIEHQPKKQGSLIEQAAGKGSLIEQAARIRKEKQEQEQAKAAAKRKEDADKAEQARIEAEQATTSVDAESRMQAFVAAAIARNGVSINSESESDSDDWD